MSTKSVALAGLLALFSAGCLGHIDNAPDGGLDAGTIPPDAGLTGDAGFVPAPHAALPMLVFNSGTTLRNPQLVTISWVGFEFETNVQAFGDGLVTSQWWPTVTSEYGVQALTHLKKVVLTPNLPATMTDADLTTLIAARIADGTLPSPATTPDLIFVVYVPPGTQLDANAVTQSGVLCGYYYGYHNFSTYNGMRYPYVVTGDCRSQVADVTAIASHEIAETATDPYFDGYHLAAPANDDWYLFSAYECADLCQLMPYTTEFGYTLSTSWSNAAAAGGSNPCQPVPTGEVPYANVSPPDSHVHVVAAGSSLDIPITGWAIAPRIDWPVVVADRLGTDFLTNPSISVGTFNNGTTATLTVSVPAGTPSGKLGVALLWSGSTKSRFWPVMIQAQ